MRESTGALVCMAIAPNIYMYIYMEMTARVLHQHRSLPGPAAEKYPGVAKKRDPYTQITG